MLDELEETPKLKSVNKTKDFTMKSEGYIVSDTQVPNVNAAESTSQALVPDEKVSSKPKSRGDNVSNTLVPNTVNTLVPNIVNTVENPSRAVAIHSQFSGDLEALDEKVKSLMQRGHTMIANGKQADGRPKLATTSFRKVYGKEGVGSHIRNHIEFNHFEGISLPCDFCEKVFGTRNYLRKHKNKIHK